MTVARAIMCLLMLFQATPALAAKRAMSSGERIDINRASVTQLMRLPGVGKKRALAIQAYRAHQPFRRPEDLLQVNGLSAGWLQRVKEHLTFTDPRPLPVPQAGSSAVK